MGSAPLSADAVRVEDTVVCTECGQANTVEETYCSACGVTLEESDENLSNSMLAPLTVGTILADTYLITSVVSTGQENRYQATRQAEDERLFLISERLRDRSHDLPNDSTPDLAGRERDGLFGLNEHLVDIRHPALLLPEECIETEERIYLASPIISGIRLSSRIGRTTEREAVGWGVQLCQAISVLQRHGLLCIELPPDSLVLDKDGRLHLSQLEALRLRDTTHDNYLLTDGYAAPEAYKPGALGETADVFAIGACLYAILVGKRLPVEGWAVQPEPPVFYPEKVLTPALERILGRALALEPTERYADPQALKTALLTLNRSASIRSAWRTDVGQVRDHNEDAVLVKEVGQGTIAGDNFNGLYIVSDGMGGAEAGEVASQMAIQTVAEQVEAAWAESVRAGSVGAGSVGAGSVGAGSVDDDSVGDDAAWETRLREAVEAANNKIVQYGKDHPESAGLGATIVAVLVRAERLTLAWVGDSRVYLFERGALCQLSQDHSLVSRLVEIGQLTPEEALTHEHRNVLIRSLGSKKDVTVDTLSRSLKRGARLLLCSDGLTAHVDDSALADILSRHRTPYDAALELTVAANTGGGSDNTSVVVVFHE